MASRKNQGIMRRNSVSTARALALLSDARDNLRTLHSLKINAALPPDSKKTSTRLARPFSGILPAHYLT